MSTVLPGPPPDRSHEDPDVLVLDAARELAEVRFRALGPSGRTSTWWGATVALGAIVTVLGSLGYSYAYLRISTTAWPPAGVPHLGLLAGLVPWVPLVVACAAHVRRWLGIGTVAGAAFVAAQTWAVIVSDLRPTVTAYEAIVVTTIGVVLALASVATLVSAGAWAASRRAEWAAAAAESGGGASALWWGIAASWLVLWPLLHLGSRWL